MRKVMYPLLLIVLIIIPGAFYFLSHDNIDYNSKLITNYLKKTSFIETYSSDKDYELIEGQIVGNIYIGLFKSEDTLIIEGFELTKEDTLSMVLSTEVKNLTDSKIKLISFESSKAHIVIPWVLDPQLRIKSEEILIEYMTSNSQGMSSRQMTESGLVVFDFEKSMFSQFKAKSITAMSEKESLITVEY